VTSSRPGLACIASLFTASLFSQTPSERVIASDLNNIQGPRDMAWQECVGSGHAALLMSPANLQQMGRVEREIGFHFVRFHGLLTDDMNVYREVDGKPVYDFSGIDTLYDKLLHLGVKPFVEFGFMPNALASGKQEIFFWHANVTPPKDMDRWSALIRALTQHLQDRYGTAEVKTWRFEVWNEPNYPGFWPNADQAAYFKLYDATASAVKSVNPAFKVGGPATAGAGWVPEFLAHTQQVHAPVDFVSTHTYAVSSGFLDADGNADLVLSSSPEAISGDVARVHQQIQASYKPSLPLDITEWSASYSSRDPVHDSYTSAAFVLEKLKQTEGLASAMSYWTYSDLFEENGPPPAAFHGGFGLLTRDNIPKATYFAYKYLNQLGPTQLKSEDNESWVTRKGDDVEALVWSYVPLKQSEGNKAFYRKLHPAEPVAPVDLKLTGLRPGRYRLIVHRTGYRRNDAYSDWIDMGMPKDLTSAQLITLEALTQDSPELSIEVRIDAGGLLERTLPMHQNDLVLVTLQRE
jgi:xylan 1,4-beta-xylosidase